MKAWLILGLCCLVCASARPAETVGEWGDPARIEFEGAKTFRAEEIRNGLLRYPDFLLASHPVAPLGKYVSALGSMIRLGYLNEGFPQPKIEVTRQDPQRVLVRIEEGPRFRCGAIRIKGASRVPADALTKRLSEPASPLARTAAAQGSSQVKVEREEGPAWTKGDYASFTEMVKTGLGIAVTNALAELGWLFAKTEVELKLIPDGNEAELVVHILEEGPAGEIGAIAVEGNERNRAEDIIAVTGLKAGMALNRQVMLDSEEKLWRAARFLSYEIGATLPENSKTANVTIKVREYAKARPLNEEWSPEEQAVLRVCNWLAEYPTRGEDLFVEMAKADVKGVTVELIFSADGMLGVVKKKEGAFVLAGYISHQEASLFSVTQKNRIAFESVRLQFITSLHLLPNADPQAENPFNLSLSGGIKSMGADEDLGAATVDLRLAPVAFIDFLKRDGVKITLQEGQLVAQSEDSLLRADAASGRVRELKMMMEDGDVAFGLEKGLFRRRQAAVRQELGEVPKVNQPGRTISALAEMYIFNEIALGPYLDDRPKGPTVGQRRAAAAAWNKLIAADVLEPVDQILAQFGTKNTNAFAIPLDARLSKDPMALLASSAAAYVFQFSNQLFPKESWPWTVSRETVFVVMGRGEYTGQELDRLYGSREMGPLGYLAVAKLLSLAGQKASLFAVGGLTRLTTDDFQQDWKLLTEGLPALRKSSMRIADALATFTPAEVEALSGGSDMQEAFASLIKLLQENRDETPELRLRLAGDLIWELLLKGIVRAELRKLIK